LVGIAVGGKNVAVGGKNVAVGGKNVAVGGMNVAVGGMDVAVGGTAVAVGGFVVAVGGTEVAVGGFVVAVGGTAVAVGGFVVAVGGMAVAVAVGGTAVLVGVAATGLLVESPGKVRAIISWRLVNPSPSESRFSIAAKAAEFLPAALYAAPNGLRAGMELVWQRAHCCSIVPEIMGYFVTILLKSAGAAETDAGMVLIIIAATSENTPVEISANRMNPFDFLSRFFLCILFLLLLISEGYGYYLPDIP
jgi:hypothetical protein